MQRLFTSVSYPLYFQCAYIYVHTAYVRALVHPIINDAFGSIILDIIKLRNACCD